MDNYFTKIENEIVQEFNNNVREYKNLLKKYDELLKEMKIEPTKRENFNAKFMLLLKKMPPMINSVFKHILNEELEKYYDQINSFDISFIPYFNTKYDIKETIKMIIHKNKNDDWENKTDYYEFKIHRYLNDFLRNCFYSILSYVFFICVIFILSYIYF
jgi:hypothetical protein